MTAEDRQGRADAPVENEHLSEAGGLHYQQARRHADEHPPHIEPTRTRRRPEPDQRQRADDHGVPDPEDESWLQDQGYPKLGRKIESRVTQVEHGPYAGGTQQGDTDSAERSPSRSAPSR
jgi:hypothetical protein